MKTAIIRNVKKQIELADKTQEILPRIFMELAYDGTDFCGWQIQPNGLSVQEVIEEKLARIYAGKKVKIESSGRTDAGVHALGQTITFTPPGIPYVEDEKLQRALNRMLPVSIRILDVKRVAQDFHARYSAVGKAYTYVINTGKPNPFLSRLTWHIPDFTEICEIRKSVKYLKGKHDFSSFTVERKNIERAERTIFKINVQSFGDLICITFIGDGFLYKMIRSIMGTLYFVGTDKIRAEEVKDIILQKNRKEAYDTAPPQGLFLMKVFYEEENMKKFRLKKVPFYVN